MGWERIGEASPVMVVNEPDNTGGHNKTVVIGGIPRGGTTMVAATVDALGVYLGPEEDLKLKNCFEDQTMNSPYLDVQHDYIKKNDNNHAVWGWKDPGVIHPLNELGHALRGPRVMIVFRDMLASIQGEMRFDIKNGIDPRSYDSLVENTMNRYADIWKFSQRTRLPLMLISYERAINNREDFVDQVIDFIGLQVTPDQRQEAIDRIAPDGGYFTQ